MQLIVCSNSGPARPSNPDEKPRAGAAGGLLPHLLSLLDESGGEWFFPDNEPAGAQWPDRAQNIALHPLSIGEQQRRLHYEIISIETLLWLFHYLHDTVIGPTFDARLHEAWAAYRQVNRLFAERLASAVNGRGDDTVVLVNDYHFLLVPGMLSGLRLPAGARIIYSHQVPWCEPDYFGILPAALREQILTSLLSCDAIVFHASKWAEAFSRCCDRYLPTAKIGNGPIVLYQDRRTRLVVAPLPLDARNLSGLQHAEATLYWRRRLDELAQGRRLLVRVDRLDLWKNHVRGLAAYQALLRRHPALLDEVWFVNLVARPRYRSPRHAAYEAACEAAVARTNETARGHGGSEAVSLLHPTDPGTSRHRAIAALGQASVVLINPTYDGLNLVAKEAAALSDTSAILLSRTAGAYEHIADAVAPLDPFDVSGTADALESAILTGARANPALAAAVRDRLRLEDAGAWLRALLGGEAVPDVKSG